MLCSELLIRLHSLFLQSPYQSANFCHFGRKAKEMQIKAPKTPQKARHSVTNAGPIIFSKRAPVPLGSTESPLSSPALHIFYFSINFLAALSWCLITLRNSWLSCSTFR